MRSKSLCRAALLVGLGAGALLQGCPVAGLLDECFGDQVISPREYDDLNFFEQALYERNACGSYEPHEDLDSLSDLF